MSSTCQQIGLTPADLSKLTKLLGMLGSDHAGERASAGLLATRLLRDARVTWDDVLTPTRPNEPRPPGKSLPPNRHADQMVCHRHSAELTEWEAEFLESIARRQALTERQLLTLNEMANKLRKRGFV